jgi:hypothetical protein
MVIASATLLDAVPPAPPFPAAPWLLSVKLEEPPLPPTPPLAVAISVPSYEILDNPPVLPALPGVLLLKVL